jgi:hypothetical protein
MQNLPGNFRGMVSSFMAMLNCLLFCTWMIFHDKHICSISVDSEYDYAASILHTYYDLSGGLCRQKSLF